MATPFRVRLAAQKLHRGGVVAYPTEAVWGLGCDPWNEAALHRLLALKQRSVAQGVILVAASLRQCEPWLVGLDPVLRQRLARSWPGPVTFLIPDNGATPDWIRGDHDAVALRISAHPTVRALCEGFGGPVVSTSANPHGRAAARSRLRVQRYFGDALDAIVPGVVDPAAGPSEIRELTTGRVLRPASTRTGDEQ